jgi:hypothetical protein
MRRSNTCWKLGLESLPVVLAEELELVALVALARSRFVLI